MKKLLLVAVVLASLSVKAQTYKVPITGTNSYYLFTSLDDNKKQFTLVSDTLYIHKKIEEKIEEQIYLHRYLRWRGKVYRYTRAVYDYAYMHGNRKNAIHIY